jgi:hypothetical protein
MKLNEDEAERMLAYKRWLWQLDQAALRQDSYDKGLADGEIKAEAEYRPVIEAKDRAIAESREALEVKDRAIEAKDRAIEELRRKLREAGLD